MSRRTTITVDVDIDLDDELDDDMLLAMVKARGLSADDSNLQPGAMTAAEWWHELADDIRTAARDNDRTHLDVLLLRMADGAELTRFKPTHASPHKRRGVMP
jgi:hypothetical protein